MNRFEYNFQEEFRLEKVYFKICNFIWASKKSWKTFVRNCYRYVLNLKKDSIIVVRVIRLKIEKLIKFKMDLFKYSYQGETRLEKVYFKVCNLVWTRKNYGKPP